MDSLADIIKAGRKEKGWSQIQLAEELGVEQPTVQRWEAGTRSPRRELLAALSRSLTLNYDLLLRASAGASMPETAARPAPPPAPMLQRDLPVYGTALGADLEFMNLDGHPVAIEQTMLHETETRDMIRRLPALQDERDAYALYTQGSSMEPAFEDGDPVPVTPSRPVRPRDYVVVHLVRPDGDGGEEAAAVLIKRLIRRSGSFVELEQFNPPAQFRVDAQRVKAIHRIMRWPEASGL